MTGRTVADPAGSVAACGWRRDSSGVIEGGDPGGDVQAGDAWSSRWNLPGAHGSLITVQAYPVHARDGYAVQLQVEFMICAAPEDPGSTEKWSDCAFGMLPGAYKRLQAAEAAARHAAGELPPGAARWDGQCRQVPSALTRRKETDAGPGIVFPDLQPAPESPADRARGQQDER